MTEFRLWDGRNLNDQDNRPETMANLADSRDIGGSMADTRPTQLIQDVASSVALQRPYQWLGIQSARQRQESGFGNFPEKVG